MTLEPLEKEILDHAYAEARQITQEAQAEVQLLRAEAVKRTEETIKKISVETQEKKHAIEQMHTVQTALQTKQEFLREKKAIIDEVYEEFANVLEQEHESMLEALFAKATQQFKPATVIVRPADAQLAKKLFKGLAVEIQPMRGGFILESADGTERMDYRFETLIELLRTKTAKTVAHELFGD
ncbi:MAG: hypothetical protein HY832_01905 [Candidatus Aenigmarchaeota archaeon]|nr:hypothetical protein [Candidatus Aenigmarchaeota archaeon]